MHVSQNSAHQLQRRVSLSAESQLNDSGSDCMTVKPKGVGILIFLLILLALGGCRRERRTEVTIQGEASPTFTFKGSGKLASFSVYLVPPSPEEMIKPLSEQAPVWRISAVPDYLHGVQIEDVGTLPYGAIPRGYKQEVPGNGDPVRSLIPDRNYFFDARTTDAPPAAGFFRIENGKVSLTKVNTPCWQTKNGVWVKSPCAE